MSRLISKLFLSVAGALFAAQLSHAQPSSKVYRIGILDQWALKSARHDALFQGLRDLNYVEGRNVSFVLKSADGVASRFPKLAEEIVAAKVDVIVATTGVAALAAKRATTKIPIVMASSSDAVAMGIVDSLAHPGGNVTGFTIISPELAPKRLELLAGLKGIRRVAVPWCSTASTTIVKEELGRVSEVAARLKIQVEPIEYRVGSTTTESLIGALKQARADAIFLPDCTVLPFAQLLELSLKERLPLITPYLNLAEQGALLAYGANTLRQVRRAATLVDKILKGAKPGDIPVEQPKEYELIVNLKTARALGLTVPQSLLLRATRIIE